ncbi:V-type proton ATPase subunit S1-like isoform X2 [Brienomyrus brachyistius]|uniref:V-type proton ATPase subunit S1-like isoform X2 n=1 Tax=Brienomyrus brachyistius TaxID=42636 RepID=UPI0020B2EB82|nr:V-type proton ATPase subunit S1-like isoform X2 [Brienomyrus brachyistius]
MVVSVVSKMTGTTVLFAILFSVFSAGSCSAQVPLVMWSSEGYSLPQQVAPLAGHIVSGSQLASYLKTALTSGPQNVLLFLQDKLSMDDFTLYGGVFGNKQDSAFPTLEAELRSSASPLVLPALSWPDSGAIPRILQEQLGTSPLYLDPETLSQLRLNASGSSLLIFRLPYSTDADMISPKAVLTGNDDMIRQVLNIIKGQAIPYTAIYTAVRPSRVIQEVSLESLPVARTLLQAPASEPYPPLEFRSGVSTCILFWAENLTVSHFQGQWRRHGLSSQTFGSSASVSLTGSTCNQTHSRLVLNYQNILNFRTFRLIFSMSRRFYQVSGRHWFTLDQVQLEYDGQKATFNSSRNIYAPSEYSYRCKSVTSFRDPLLVPRTANDNATQWRLSFDDFQIQGFNVTGSDFSYASDCASFFTPGVWMGLLTSLLMLLVLTYGLHMIIQLRTMDRFDDPKGPAIAVPQNE